MNTKHYFVDENGRYQGSYESYYENGQLDVKGTYIDGTGVFVEGEEAYQKAVKEQQSKSKPVDMAVLAKQCGGR